MCHLGVIGANKVNGVAVIHTWLNGHILSAGLDVILPYSICSQKIFKFVHILTDLKKKRILSAGPS